MTPVSSAQLAKNLPQRQCAERGTFRVEPGCIVDLTGPNHFCGR